MNVKDLIAELMKLNPEARVECEYMGESKCDTCGPEAESSDITKVIDLETRVILTVLGWR